MSFFSIYDVLKCFTQTPRFSANYFIIGNRIFNSCTEYQNVRVNITSGYCKISFKELSRFTDIIYYGNFSVGV